MGVDGVKENSLVRMGNQIATFFESMPDRQEASLDLVTHLQKFWEPRMRREFLSLIDAGHVESMHPLLLSATQQHRALIE